jgi:hypothetical protein
MSPVYIELGICLVLAFLLLSLLVSGLNEDPTGSSPSGQNSSGRTCATLSKVGCSAGRPIAVSGFAGTIAVADIPRPSVSRSLRLIVRPRHLNTR